MGEPMKAPFVRRALENVERGVVAVSRSFADPDYTSPRLQGTEEVHPFFGELGGGNKNGDKEELVTALLFVDEHDFQIAHGAKAYEKFVEDHKGSDREALDKLTARAKRMLDLLYSVFKGDMEFLRGSRLKKIRGEIYPFLAKVFTETCRKSGMARATRDFLRDLYNEVAAYKAAVKAPGSDLSGYRPVVPMIAPSERRSKDTTYGIRDMMARNFFERYPQFAPGGRRGFTEDQRVLILHAAGGVCEECSEPISLEEMEAHHVVPYSQGGKTEVENGQALCQGCHKDTHA